ncbi:type II toxin-antitoxin system PemK/MazF family toxin [Arthrobacter sp. BHU FT2]|nr:type II toxin-antitoxin system PemK/MazF family toxin [Arthrobacter sp. BHU FT2]
MAITFRTMRNAVLRLLGARDRPRPAGRSAGSRTVGTAAGMGAAGYPGDFTGRAAVRYAPKPDGRPDPGEVVWTWVPYEEDYTQGKDRPVLIVGRSGAFLLALMLTSRDRVPAGSAAGDYVDVGTGAWDRQRRPSEARLDRVLTIRPEAIRREGAVLGRARFVAVADALRNKHGWS